MKKMSSRTSVRYTSALASNRPGARTCHPSSYVVATTGFKAGSGPRANGSGQAACGSAHASSTMAGARNPRLTDANTSCPPPPFHVSPTRGDSRRKMCRPFCDASRSEEHTSELQSRLHLVCRLLLEKKKKKTEH